MYIKDRIAYAGEPKPPIKVCGVRPMKKCKLWLRFNTGEDKIFDITPLLHMPAFAPLSNWETFSSVYIDWGVVTWNDGEIDIAPELLTRRVFQPQMLPKILRQMPPMRLFPEYKLYKYKRATAVSR